MNKIDVVQATVIKTNNYIISDGKGAVLIEASANPEEIKNIIKDKTLLAILLTHGHWDHFLKLNELLETFSCKVYITKQGFEKINLKGKNFYADRNPSMNIPKERVVFIKENEVLDFGKEFQFRVIGTPGHTDCSVSYLLNDKDLFSGDTLFKDDYGRSDLPTGNEEAIQKSLQFLMTLNPDIKVYPGHGAITTIENERKSFNWKI